MYLLQQNQLGILPVCCCCWGRQGRVDQTQVSSSKLGQGLSQKDSTKLAGNSPVLPVRCCVPLYQPSSRLRCTYITSPTRSSSSYSLLGGYATTHRNLKLTTTITNCTDDNVFQPHQSCSMLQDLVIFMGHPRSSRQQYQRSAMRQDIVRHECTLQHPIKYSFSTGPKIS